MATKNSYRSRFSPESHFFTDPSVMTQNEAQIFGPINDREFRLTTKFNAPAATAFAICKGIVLIQPQVGSSDKVNLILRPYTQPITGFNIKYFIYRGLDKSSFFAADQVIEKSDTSSDLINKVNKDFLSFHQKENEPIPPFLAKYLGYNPLVQEDALMIDSFFFKETELVEENGSSSEIDATAFELPLVEMGESLGNFSGAEAGIDIVLNYGDYQLPLPNEEFVFDLAYARAKEAVITLDNNLSDFKKKVKREQIFQFLDAAAFFGFHSDGGKVKIDHNGTKVSKTAGAIYDEVIFNFKTKNRLYLYIQSDRTRSYNFYGNYTISEGNANSIKIGNSLTGLTEGVYGIQGWPIIINEAVQGHQESRNKLFLQLVTDNHINTMLYGQVAEIENAQHNNFCNAEDLRLPDSPEGIPSSFTKIIELSNPAVGPEGAKVNVASFNILIYQGRVYNYLRRQVLNDQNQSIAVYDQPNFFDEVFHGIQAMSLLKAGNYGYYLISHQKIKLINHYYGKEQKGISAVQSVIVRDRIKTGTAYTGRITYLTDSVDQLKTNVSTTSKISTDIKGISSVSASNEDNYEYQLPEPFYHTLKPFTDNAQLINGLILNTSDQSIPSKIILGLSEVENELLKSLIAGKNMYNSSLVLIDLFEDGSEFISTENIWFQKYKVGIVGEENGQLKLYLPENDIMVYSLDRKYHFSDEYSKNVKEEVKLDLILDLDIYM
ncbi:hypothetical protein [Pedobacter sp. PACM 27299]|uniref:hypothetical protein n=1 Tax=Pedobacter sp. PACM 27299 TaxID=1727164 RepID=UPI000AB51C3D|nr:hypothetical protein [Pedobacter sp. PACM 27299]